MKITKEEFIKKVEAAKLDEVFQIADGFPYKNFSFDNIDEDGEFSWAAERDYQVTGSVGYIFPMRTTQLVKTFKTMAGAKKNMIKYFNWLFTKEV
jgi:hypothetical protein